MLVAGQGLPSPGSAGYELMDKAQTLGSTQFRDEVTYLRALEGELSRTIGSLSGVRGAKVHIVMAKREPFSRDWTPPTASVLLSVASPDLVGRQQVAAIRHLVASAVPRLSIQNVSIIDNFGSLLAGADNGEGAELDRADQRRIALEDRIQRALEEQLTPIVGAGRVRAKVSAELDLSSERSVQETYDPLGQVPRSQQTETERQRNADTKQNVSVEKDLPENAGKPPAGGGKQSEQDRSKQTINYEIGKTTREFSAGTGKIKRLSISIAVDGVCEVDAQGRTNCRPRTAEELALLERLARATAGFSAERGDTFEIASMPFSALEPNIVSEAPPLAPPGLLDALMAHPVLAALGGALVLALLGALGFALLRARKRRAEAEARALAAEAEARAALEAAEAKALEAARALAQPEGQALLADGSAEGAENPVVELGGNVQGGVRRATIQQVQQLIDANLDEAVAFLKIWLHDKAKAR
jgi:flagellar M-ring protein FliF